MNSEKKLTKNILIGFTAQITSLFFQFICRKIFLQYLGVELLGLSSTMTSILNALSLAELGFENAIIYSLYTPLNRNDHVVINDIINIFRFVYHCVAGFLLICTFICTPLLKNIITGMEWGNYIYAIFYLHAGSVILSYCIAYKRSLLYADQKDYIAKLIDMICNILFSLGQIIYIAKYRDIYGYLFLKIFQIVISNELVNLYCRKKYPFLHQTKINTYKFREIFSNVKQIFVAKIAGYIYSSTDSLVISALINTISVGYLANYTTVTTAIRNLIESILKPAIPYIGNLINNDKTDQNKEKKLFELYMHIRYLISCFIVIPLFILLNEVIGMLFGTEYILELKISLLLCGEMYLYFTYGGATAFINGKGLFKYEKNIEIIGAISNIIVSIILAQLTGLSGVLTGTVFSQCLYAIGRTWIVFKYNLTNDIKGFFKYWFNSIINLLIFIFSGSISYYVSTKIFISFSVIQLLVRGLVTEFLILIICFGCLRWNPHQKYLKTYFTKTIREMLK